MEDLRLKLEVLKRWWEDDHRQLVRLAAAGDRTHVVQRERELRRFSGSALDLQYAATEKQVRVSAQDAVTEGMAEELSLKELIHGVVASQKVLTENVALQQATIRRLSKQQGELLQAMALTPMRHEHCNGNNRPLNDECYYCHRRGHIKRNCAALKRAQRNNAELASIARRHRGKRRGDSVVDSACLKQRQSSRESSSEARKQTFAKQRARLLAEHANAMLARDRELETLEEKCRALTQQLKAALDTRVMNSAIYDDKPKLENVIKLSAKEKLQLRMKQVECDALKQTIEDGDKKHGILGEALKSATDENVQLTSMNSDLQQQLVQLSEVELLMNCSDEPPRADAEWVQNHQHRRRDASETACMHMKQHADDRTKQITESCDEYDRMSSGETVGSRVETHDKDGQRIRRESSDEGIGLSCGDTDDVIEGRGIVEGRRRFERGRHQPVRLTGRPRRLLGTQDRSAVVKTRRRCLPCVPAREANIGDIDMSAEAVREVLVRALERSRGEHSSETLCMPSRRDAGWRPTKPVRFAPFGVGMVTTRRVANVT